MINLSEMREKEVINIRNGAKLGYIYDFEIDLENGKVISILIPYYGKVLGFFGKNRDLVIPWQNIFKIGHDIILVDIDVDNTKELDNFK
ncbi:MAG TPA: YlmC/YmxH family sporulation protein [Tissierellia bacterium]|nr:YlmC/YmxH family sporulation protein [Tissierellia bacterium]